MAEKILDLYECPECSSVYNDHGDAASCCPTDVSTVMVCAACFEHDEQNARGFHRQSQIDDHLKVCVYLTNEREDSANTEFALVFAGVNRVDIERFKEYRDGVDEDTRYIRRTAGTSPFADLERLVATL